MRVESGKLSQGESIMSESAVRLLEAFDSLPANEKHEVMAALLRISGELATTPMSDEDLTGLADELFQTLDEEEADDGSPTR